MSGAPLAKRSITGTPAGCPLPFDSCSLISRLFYALRQNPESRIPNPGWRVSPTLALPRGEGTGRSLGICPEPEEPMFLGESVDEVLLGDFLAREMLTRPGLHPCEFDRRRLPQGRVPAAVAFDDLLEEIGPLQHDASARRLRRRLPEILEEFRFRHGLVQVPVVVADRLLRELDDGAGLHVAERADVMADPRRGGAEGLT